MRCLTALLSAGEMAGGEVCSENKAWAVASRHSFLEDTNVVFNGHWPHAHSGPGMCSVWALPVIKAVTGEGEASPPGPQPELCSCRKKECFDLDFPPCLFSGFHELSCLHRKLQFSFLQLPLLHCKGFTPEYNVKIQGGKNAVW